MAPRKSGDEKGAKVDNTTRCFVPLYLRPETRLGYSSALTQGITQLLPSHVKKMFRKLTWVFKRKQQEKVLKTALKYCA